MATKFFDTPEVNGFTLRTCYEESGGIVTITDIQLRSRVFGGPGWYPGGEITVNGTEVLQMQYISPVTHLFNIGSAGENFVSAKTLSGPSFPVSTARLTAKKAEISVQVRLYRDQNTAKPALAGTVEIPLTAGFVHVKHEDKDVRCRAVAKVGGKIKPCRVGTIHNGTFRTCG